MIDDKLYEPEEEYFTIILTSTDDSVHVSIAAIVSIIDDDGKKTQYLICNFETQITMQALELSKIRCQAGLC